MLGRSADLHERYFEVHLEVGNGNQKSCRSGQPGPRHYPIPTPSHGAHMTTSALPLLCRHQPHIVWGLPLGVSTTKHCHAAMDQNEQVVDSIAASWFCRNQAQVDDSLAEDPAEVVALSHREALLAELVPLVLLQSEALSHGMIGLSESHSGHKRSISRANASCLWHSVHRQLVHSP